MDLLSGFVGAILGVALTLIFNVWKFHRDERTARCDELCQALTAYGAVASEYWATTFHNALDQKVTEATILGGQALIDGLYADLRSVLTDDEGERTDKALSAVFDLISGGEFSVNGRATDTQRLSQIPQAASAAILEIRRANRRTFPLGTIVTAYHNNRRRKLDMPSPCL